MDVLNILSEHYPICFDKLEQLRDGGSTSYAAFSGGDKYFLRVIKPAFFDTAIIGADIQVFLQRQDFPVPPIIFVKDSFLYVKTDNSLLILYEFIEGGDSEPERDAEAIGALIGRLHQIMKSYPGKLVKRDKHFFIGRYIDILRKKQYLRTDEYAAYGDALWNKIKDLPHGYCPSDMYDGNIRKTQGGKLYIHDFDTSCEGFPMYDTTLICNMTKYFEYDERNYDRSNQVLARFLPEYRKYSALSQEEINAFHALIAVQHFSTQATVMECFGLDCLDEADMDNQLDWLYRWREQCESGNEDDIGLSNMFTNIKDQLDNPIVWQIIAASLFDASPEGLDKWAARLRDNDDKQLYGWVKNGDIVGVCAFLPHPDKVEILNIATVENSRRRGIGGAMVTALQDIYQLPIEAETDNDAVGFYRNCGFEATAIYKQYSNDTFLRWTCVLPAPECLLQETDEEPRPNIPYHTQ